MVARKSAVMDHAAGEGFRAFEGAHELLALAQRTSAQAPISSAADTPGSTATTASVMPGSTFYGQLEVAGDHDWIAIDLNAGQHVSLILSGFGANELVDPYLYLRDQNGVLITENDDIDPGIVRDSRIEFTAQAGGTYYLDVGAWDEGYAGDYQLQVFDATSTTDTITANTATSARMEFGGIFNGVLERNADRDYVAIDLVAGVEYTVRVAGAGVSALVNPQLNLRGPNGAIIQQNDNANGLNPEITFTASTSGTYYLDIGSSAAASRGEYSVSVAESLKVFTYDQIATQLTSNYWGDGTHAFVVGADGSLTVNVTAISAGEQKLARAALTTWSDITGIRFVETTGAAEITFTNNEPGAASSSTYSASGAIISSVVNVSSQWFADYGPSLDSYSMQTYIHEIGHAIGLGHAGNYNGNATFPLDALYLNDAWSTTVMSYFAQDENTYFASQGFSLAYLTTPMAADVVAVTALYGASTTTRVGNTIYGFNSNAGNPIFNANSFSQTAYCVVDSGGIDTLDYSNFAQDQLIDLNPERFMNIGGLTGNVVIGRGTVIERAIGGAGSDHLIGNDAANILTGNAGNDQLEGNAGNDRLFGGLGTDVIWGGNGADTLDGGADLDRLYGGAGNDTADGGDARDLIYGGSGYDTLRGGAGNDMLNGGAGNDTLYGDAGNDRLIGGDGADTLFGGDGIDVLIGGRGLDVLTGGLGADQFQLDVAAVAGNAVTITDFQHLLDSIVLDRSVFSAISANGQLASDEFVFGEARDANDHVVYNRSTGEIFYDADGVGGADMTLIATVDPGTILWPRDFLAIA